jgi:non-ribosomal peptide synthetase component E (peptide arylation enzyme)
MRSTKGIAICTICLTFALLCTVAYAAKKYPMTAASIVPGARGEVVISQDKNGNTGLKMTVQHLASVENLTPRASAYVVWLQERGGNPENQGQLKVDKNLKATFETVTPFKSFEVFVTAEQDSRVKSPSGPEVLMATIQP